ncbi:phosphopantetheine-binding protein, partial [Pantoea ananatis]|uniref:phosphopantetheine-binding protein n=1 Tax=Pantoea ananas TaxID=553 RepID=UPI00221FF884|nr:phosphopantetheine-binding protein [Pantoea ananatis]
GTCLPDYMVPSLYVAVDEWPLSGNGKLERSRLPAPDAAAALQRAYVAPEGEAEQVLARIWSQVLDVPRIGRHDNFFELGGDSMRSIAGHGLRHRRSVPHAERRAACVNRIRRTPATAPADRDRTPACWNTRSMRGLQLRCR